MTAPVIAGARWLGRWDVGSPEWQQARATRIGGSEIAAVIGVSPWESRYSLWQRKRGAIRDKPSSQSMEWGTELEPVVIRKFLANHPELSPIRGSAGTWVNNLADWMLANPDGLMCDQHGQMFVLEAKTADAGDAWQWGTPGTDDIPPHYIAQVRWYLGALGLEVAYLVVLIGGNQLREYVIRQDPDDLRLMLTEAKTFMDSLDAGRPPALDEHKATYQAVREVHPDISPREVELDPALVGDYTAACLDEKAAVNRRRLISARVLDAMGDARKAMCGGQHVAIRVSNRGATPHLRPHPALTKDYT